LAAGASDQTIDPEGRTLHDLSSMAAMAEKPQVVGIHKETSFPACVCLKLAFEFQSFV
jgi:hypothetical protein